MSDSGRRWPRYATVVILAAAAFALSVSIPWHPDPRVRRAAGIVLATLILWITEVMPLGITGLLIPVAATFAGVLKWSDALTAWGDPILFLFLGAFLLARALDKHGAFDFLVHARWARRFHGGHGSGLAIVVMLVAGAVSTMQSNTAVTAMLLPVVLALARKVRNPALVLLGLSYGATFGGMATPIGTPPNFIGYAEMKKLGGGVSFLSWMRVGVPVWLGTTVLAWGLLTLARLWLRGKQANVGEQPAGDEPREADLTPAAGLATAGVAGRAGRRAPAAGSALAPSLVGDALDAAELSELESQTAIVDGAAAPSTDRAARSARMCAIAAFGLTVVLWLSSGLVTSLTDAGDPSREFVERYLPESLPPILAACILFVLHVGPQRKPILDRRDFQVLDWDTLFLIAGGLCLGKMLQASGAATALATAVGSTHLSPLLVMFGLGSVTVLLSELTSNTATAALLVPIGASLAPAVGMSPVQATWLVALCASLGFALPVSTPPNAIIYGTRLVPLRLMAVLGIIVDILSLIWVVTCVRWLA